MPPTVAVLTDWLSMMQALGCSFRPCRTRSRCWLEVRDRDHPMVRPRLDSPGAVDSRGGGAQDSVGWSSRRCHCPCKACGSLRQNPFCNAVYYTLDNAKAECGTCTCGARLCQGRCMTDTVPRHVGTTSDAEEAAYLELALADEQSVQSVPAATEEPVAPAARETVLVLDFGSQYTRLIARRIRECRVYCELLPPPTPWPQILARCPRGIVLSGGPASVYDPGAPQAPAELWDSGIPVLGICYGMGLLAQGFGGEMARVEKREYGPATLDVVSPHLPAGVCNPPLPSRGEREHTGLGGEAVFTGLPERLPVWMSHGDALTRLPEGFRELARTASSVAAIGDDRGHVGLMFHPEVAHTSHGTAMIDNFLKRICGCAATWTPGNVIADSVARIKAQVGGGRVICALSGGVDSAVAAMLIARAVGDQLTCIFVDNGLLRRYEATELMDTFERHLRIPVVHVDAADRFLRRLAGVTDPEHKRRIVGDEFI